MTVRKLEQSEYYPIREDLIGALQRYLDHGIMPGSFMTACLENVLSEAFGRADHENIKNLHNIVGYLYNEFPADAWGSREKVQDFLKQFKVCDKNE
jgi:hypothetical protein